LFLCCNLCLVVRLVCLSCSRRAPLVEQDLFTLSEHLSEYHPRFHTGTLSTTFGIIWIEIKNTIDTAMSASYFDLHPDIDSEGLLRTKLYDTRVDFNSPLWFFPFTDYMWQLSSITCIWSILYLSVYPVLRACGSFHDFHETKGVAANKEVT
jgi:hypothetical protein